MVGLDPGALGTNTLILTGAPPGATVKFKYQFSDSGSKTLRRGICVGKTLDFSNPRTFGTVTADQTGTAAMTVNLDSGTFANQTVYMQARVETDVCIISNMVSQNIEGSSPPTAPPPTAPPPPAAGVLTMVGLDPGALGTNTLILTGAPPGATVKFKYQFSDSGSKTLRSGICAGKVLDFSSPQSFGIVIADQNGTATTTVNLDSGTFANQTVYMQARVETDVCVISNMVSQNIEGSSPSAPAPEPEPTPEPTPAPTPAPGPAEVTGDTGVSDAPLSPVNKRLLVVSKDGSGDFSSIQSALDSSQPGDTIQVKDGTYVERVNFHRSGTRQEPITLQNYPNHAPVIDPGGGAYPPECCPTGGTP